LALKRVVSSERWKLGRRGSSAVEQTTHDEVVTPYTNAFLSGANVTNITIQNQCPKDPVGHIGMFEDSPVMQNVLNQLSASPNASFAATCSKYGAGI
jgi:hypothetical protein